MKAVIDANEFRKGVREVIKDRDEAFSFFYDETNNIRRLFLTELGTNAPELRNFVLAGIVLKPDQQFPDISELNRELRLDVSATELKFKHVGRGSYEDILGSWRIEAVLKWLQAHEILAHYSNLNVLFWTLIDIVESLWEDPRFKQYSPYDAELKGELYFVVQKNVDAFLKLLHRHSYPNLTRSGIRAFYQDVAQFWTTHAPHHRSPGAKLIHAILGRVDNQSPMTFLTDNEDGLVIKDFSIFFLRSIYLFKNSSHTFDRETNVEKALSRVEVMDNGRLVDYRFVDSKSDARIQISDVICGLIGRHFNFVQDCSMTELRSMKANLTARQQSNLSLLKGLIDRSDAQSNGFCQATIPGDSHWKNNLFLHNHDDAPPFARM